MALKQYAENAHDIAETMVVYNKKLNETGFSGANPYLEETVKNNITYVKNQTKIKKVIGDVEKILDFKSNFKAGVIMEKCFIYYSELLILRNKLQECLQIFIDHQVNPVQQGSQTSTGSTITQQLIFDLQDHLSDLEEIMDSYLTESEITQLADKISHVISSSITDESDVSPWINEASIDLVTNTYELYISKNIGQYVVLLFRMIMQNAIDVNTGHSKGSKVIRKILQIMESLKTSVLDNPRMQIIQSGNKKYNTVQRIIQWNNLIPQEETQHLEDLVFKLVGVKSQEKDLDKTCKIVSTTTEKIGFIVMRKVSKIPMEHKIMALIDRDFAQSKDLLQSGNQGINETLYKRTETISMLEPARPAVHDSISVYGSPDTITHYYMLETLDGINFRALHPWSIGTKDFKIPATWVQYIPDIKKTPSTRLGAYSEIINEQIIEHLHEPFTEIDFLTRDERRKADIKWNNIRENIIRALHEEYSGKSANLSSLIASSKFQSSVLHYIVVELEKVASPGTAVKDEIYYEELALSYVKDLEAIQYRLGRELINTYQNEFRKSNNAFHDLLMKVLTKLISNKSNIFTSIQYKSELLATTLL